jgi:hypothetical protein
MMVRLGVSLVAGVLLWTGCSQGSTSQPPGDASTSDASDAAAALTSGCRIMADSEPDFICTSYTANTASELGVVNQACTESPDSVVVSACPPDPVACCLQPEAAGVVINQCYYGCLMAIEPTLCTDAKGQWTLLDGSVPCPGNGDAGGATDGGSNDASGD